MATVLCSSYTMRGFRDVTGTTPKRAAEISTAWAIAKLLGRDSLTTTRTAEAFTKAQGEDRMTQTWIDPPGEGGWRRDESHINTVLTGFADKMLADAQTEGFAKGFAFYGALLAGFDVSGSRGASTCVRGSRVHRRKRSGAAGQPGEDQGRGQAAAEADLQDAG